MITVKKIVNCKEKENIIKECDSAFQRGLIARDNYEQIFNKINLYAEFFAAYIGDEIAGYAAMYNNDFYNRAAYITMIGVREKFQRNHIGSALINKCINAAKEKSMRLIRLEVLSTNERAIAFYKHYQFNIEKPCSDNSVYMILYL